MTAVAKLQVNKVEEGANEERYHKRAHLEQIYTIFECSCQQFSKLITTEKGNRNSMLGHSASNIVCLLTTVVLTSIAVPRNSILITHTNHSKYVENQDYTRNKNESEKLLKTAANGVLLGVLSPHLVPGRSISNLKLRNRHQQPRYTSEEEQLAHRKIFSSK